MFRIKVWIPVKIDPEDDVRYTTKDEAEGEKAHLEELQPNNRYEVEEVGVVVSECQNCGSELLLERVDDHTSVGFCDGCGSKIEEQDVKAEYVYGSREADKSNDERAAAEKRRLLGRD